VGSALPGSSHIQAQAVSSVPSWGAELLVPALLSRGAQLTRAPGCSSVPGTVVSWF